MRNLIKTIFFIVAIASLVSCAGGGASDSRRAYEATDFSTYQSLVSALGSVRGLRVTGSGSQVRVQILGTPIDLTTGTRPQPIFVVDGNVIGNYSDAEMMVVVHNISSIRVLSRAQATPLYGMRGSVGVIEIRQKK